MRLLDSVSVYHPYYPYTKGHNPMLEFLTTDGGAQYLMVYYACCILADNCMQANEGRVCTNANGPFLSATQTIDGRIAVPVNDILPAGDYFFVIPDSAAETPSARGEHYAIIPTFDDWKPPLEIPLPWRQVEVPLDPNDVTPSHARDAEPCAISNVYNAVEKAHIIPKSEGRWAKQNNIRRDVRDAVIDESKGPESSGGYENIHKYQNTLIKKLQGVPAKFLFIRFAWSIYNEHIMTIFGTQSKFLVKYLVSIENDQYDYRVDTLSTPEICISRSGSSRLYSPRFAPPASSGRKRPRMDEQEDDEYLAFGEMEEDGYLSPSEMASSSIYDYDWSSDEASECDDTDDISPPTEVRHELDESVPKDE
ncbi:hypothetical protein GL218_02770 [Daldinia childiae]|uniref:uncharacterized protein n=1 Tax=Daldinia childiae TaxID=326645 RepID=UPI001444F80F|nr:uncharacterized protein GL218_02770 [Daldinia childiae]KAF3064450.1 hypothetical protein GL218_02770 [Daldinia childiae]